MKSEGKMENAKKLIIVIDDELYRMLRHIQKQKPVDPHEVALFARMVEKSVKNGTLVASWSE